MKKTDIPEMNYDFYLSVLGASLSALASFSKEMYSLGLWTCLSGLRALIMEAWGPEFKCPEPILKVTHGHMHTCNTSTTWGRDRRLTRTCCPTLALGLVRDLVTGLREKVKEQDTQPFPASTHAQEHKPIHRHAHTPPSTQEMLKRRKMKFVCVNILMSNCL